ncbi:MAG TPA: hypothetical protein VF046_02865, partial [Gemmatimonadales bacterium]
MRFLPPAAGLVVAAAVLAVLHACRDTSEPTAPARPAPPASEAVTSSAALRGRWGAVFTTPVVAVHMH